MSIFGNNSSATNEVSPNTFQTSAAGVGKPKTTVSSKGRTINENIERDRFGMPKLRADYDTMQAIARERMEAQEAAAKNAESTAVERISAIQNETKNMSVLLPTGLKSFMDAMDKATDFYEKVVYMAQRYGSTNDKKTANKIYVASVGRGDKTKIGLTRVKLDKKLTKKLEREIKNNGGSGFDNRQAYDNKNRQA